MSDAAYATFAARSPEAGFSWLQESNAHVELLREQIGERALAEYLALAQEVASAPHLAIEHPTNLILLPGIMGSTLGSKPLAGIWWLDLENLGRLNDLRLSPDGATDANPDYQVYALTTDRHYSGFLTAVMRRSDFGHDHHPYDWRKSPTLTAAGLRDQIKTVHAANGELPVHLVAHSMGGLLVRTTLMRYGEELWPLVGRIVFLGTPHYGSPAIAGYLKNHFWGWSKLVVLGHYLDRGTFRSMRGALGLLPAPADVYPGSRDGSEHPCANFDLYDASAWRLDLSDESTASLQGVLDDTAMFHRDLYTWHHSLAQEQRDRMCVIAGVGYRTLFRLEFRSHLGLWTSTAKITDPIDGNSHRMGDGRVPLASATLENVGETRYVRSVHGGLPNIPIVYEDVFRWLNGNPLQLPSSPAGALAAHMGAGPVPASLTPALDGTEGATDDDPGYLQLEPDPRTVEAMRAQVEAGSCPEFLSVGLL